MANKSIILFIIFAFTSAYSQELTEDYIKLLIKKGIITDKLCMQQTAAGVDIILRGQAYKLGYYAANEELDQFANGDSEAVAKACSSSISKYPNVKKNIQKTTIMAAQEVIKTKQGAFKKFISESDPFPTDEFNRLAKFLDNYYKRATDVQELLPEEDVNVFKEGSVKIKAIGYADGVRNTTEEYDPYIAKRLCEEADGKKANFSSGKYREEAKLLTEYFDSTVDLNSLGGSFGVHKDAFLTGWNGYDKTARDSSSDNQSAIIMSRYRNTFLAKMRADSLADKTYESISNYWSSNGAEINTNTLLIRNSDAVISDAELNPNATYMCKGFCNMRRGAKLVLDFPLSSASETGTPFFNSLTTHFEGPTSEDQLRMNKFAMKRLVEDYSQYLKDHRDEEIVKEEKRFIVEYLGNRKTPSEYQLLPLYADYECPQGNNKNCDDIKNVIDAYNKNSINKFIQSIRPTIKKLTSESHYKFLLGYQAVNPIASSLLQGLVYNIRTGYRHTYNKCGTSNDEIKFTTKPEHSKNYIYGIDDACKDKKNLFYNLFGAETSDRNAKDKLLIADSVAERESLRGEFKLEDYKDVLFILLGFKIKALEDLKLKHKDILPTRLVEIIDYHIDTNLKPFEKVIYGVEGKVIQKLNTFLNENMNIKISHLFDIGKGVAETKGTNGGFNFRYTKGDDFEKGFILNQLNSSTPLVDYFLNLTCHKRFLNDELCDGVSKSDDFVYTKLNTPHLSLSLENMIPNLDFNTSLLSYTFISDTLDDSKISLNDTKLSREQYIYYNDGYVRKPEEHFNSVLNAYFEGAFLFNKFHFDTEVPTGGERLIANFLQEKLNIPDKLDMYYFKGKEQINFSKDFFEYFKPLIRWTRNILYNSVKRSSIKSLDRFKFEPKGLPYLNYNSEINTSHLGSEYIYPLFFASNKPIYPSDPITSIHHYLLKSYYRTGISYLIGAKAKKIASENDFEYFFNVGREKDGLIKLSELESLGYLQKDKYDKEYAALKAIVDDALADAKITNIKAKDIMVPFHKSLKTHLHFVGQNMKAFTFLGQYAFDKTKNVTDFKKETLDVAYDEFLDMTKLSGFSKDVIRTISYLNSLFVYDSIDWYNNFDQNGERFAAPYYIKEGKSIEVPANTPDYNELKAEALKEKWLKHDQLAEVLSGGPAPSANGAQVSTIFSFANYSDAMADILNYVNGHSHKYRWRGKERYKKIFRRVPRNLKYIYYQPRRVQGAETDNKGEYVSGWMHIACKTGTVYPYDDKETSYHYQTRYRVQRSYNYNMKSYYNDYPSHQKYRHPYDDTFYIPNDKRVKFPIHNLVRMKRPTSYLIPNCKEGSEDPCNCLKREFENGDDLDSVISKGIELNFTDNYHWIDFNVDTPFAEKRFDLDSSLPDDREIAKTVYVNSTDKSKKIMGKSEDACLYSPLVPQSHEVGTGRSRDKDSLFRDSYGVEFAGSDFFIDALIGNINDPRTSYLDEGIEYFKEQLKEFEALNSNDNERELMGYSKAQVKDQINYYESEIAQLESLKSTDKYAIKKFKGLDPVVTDEDEVERIYKSCIQYLNNFPMSPAMCQDSASAQKEQLRESFNWCSSLPASVVSALGVNEADCIQTANSIFSDGSGKPVLSTDNINACRMLSKTFTDDGKVIHYNSSTKSVEKKEPASFFNK